MGKYVIVADSGSDLDAAAAKRHGIEIVPMHVTIGDQTIDDGDMPAQEMYDRCKELGVMPKTSGSNPGQFATAFDRIHESQPDATILYLAYSAVTTCSYESAQIAAEGRDYVETVDTQNVSVGQAAIVLRTARYIERHPDATVDEIMEYIEGLKGHVAMSFIPGDLSYLRAGGRLSNVAFLGAKLLGIKPVIEILDGKLVATKKLRGSMLQSTLKLVEGLTEQDAEDGEKSEVLLVRSPGLSKQLQRAVETRLHKKGYQPGEWISTKNVISSHCGPGTFGIVMVQA